MMSNLQQQKEIIDVFQRRYATKKFNPERKISEKDWATIMESARLAPSSFGFEPWKFLLIENPEVRQEIKEMAWGAKKTIDDVSHFIVILARKNMTLENPHIQHMIEDVMGRTFDPESRFCQLFDDFQRNDLQLTTERALFDWASKQTYIAASQMMTAAAFLDIDSCPIEGFNQEKVDDYLAQNGWMDPKKFGVSLMISFGYRDEDIKPKTRQSLEEIYEVI